MSKETIEVVCKINDAGICNKDCLFYSPSGCKLISIFKNLKDMNSGDKITITVEKGEGNGG